MENLKKTDIDLLIATLNNLRAAFDFEQYTLQEIDFNNQIILSLPKECKQLVLDTTALIEMNKAMSEEIQQLITQKNAKVQESMVDKMTGFFTKEAGIKLLETRIKHILENIQHAKSVVNRNCLIFIDANNLKVTNDNFGHHEGDFLIETIAEILGNGFRPSDLYGRYKGGDEFFIQCGRINAEQATERMQGIQTEVIKAAKARAEEKNYANDFGFSISYGIVDLTDIIDATHETIKNNENSLDITAAALAKTALNMADEKMYIYKKAFKAAVKEGYTIFEAADKALKEVAGIEKYKPEVFAKWAKEAFEIILEETLAEKSTTPKGSSVGSE